VIRVVGPRRPPMSSTDKPLLDTKVLVAEDQWILATDLMQRLWEAGANVIGPAMSVASAAEIAEEEKNLDCCILDVRFNGDLIFPVAEALKLKEVPIVFYTGYKDPEALKRNWPDAKVVIKPAPLEEVIKAVVEVCGR
jgi:CheY-like chemotaxis protein